MTKFSILVILFVTVMLFGNLSAINYLDGPESVVFDEARDRYLVTSVRNSLIAQYDLQQVQTLYKELNMGYIYSNCLYGDTMFVSLNRKIIGIDLTTDSIVIDLTLPNINHFDGITADTSGNVYVADVAGMILKVRISDLVFSPFVTSGLPTSTQDLVFDKANNRLLVVGYSSHAPIQAVDLADSSLSTLVVTEEGYFDGIEIDDNGYVYVASHNSGGIIKRYNPDFSGTGVIMHSGYGQPAGLGYNVRDRIIAVPVFGSDSVDFFPDIYQRDADQDGLLDINDNCPDNYNPEQEDGDSDLVGDACDNCPALPNTDQANSDADTLGDVCDNCLLVSNPDQIDSDQDSIGNLCDNCPDNYNPGQEDLDQDEVGDICEYICGDVNGDLSVNVSDAVYIINFVFTGGPAPNPSESGDVNCDDTCNVSDAVYIINFVFTSGNQPCDVDADEVPNC